MKKTQFQFLDWEDLEKETANQPSVLTWEIPWTEDACGLQSMGLQELDVTKQLNYHHHNPLTPMSGNLSYFKAHFELFIIFLHIFLPFPARI